MTRVILGANDDEMACIREILSRYLPNAEVLQPEGDSSAKSYTLTLEVLPGDIWIEAGRAAHLRDLGRRTHRQDIEAAGATCIDHHNPDDPQDQDGSWLFANSSIGRLLKHLVVSGLIGDGSSDEWLPHNKGYNTRFPDSEGKWVCDEWLTGSALLYLVHKGDYWGPPKDRWLFTGEADHNLAAFAYGWENELTTTSAETNHRFLLDRLERQDPAAPDRLARARSLVRRAPWLEGYEGKIKDVRAVPELEPPCPGVTSGGVCADVARLACLLEKVGWLGWGAQRLNSAGRRNIFVGGFGPGSGPGEIDHRPILTALGADGIYPNTTDRGFGGGYVAW